MPGQVLARLGEPTSLDAADAARDGSPAAPLRASVPLTRLARHASGTVAGVRVEALGPDGALDPEVERMALRLIEIGFVQGASLRVIAFGQPGDDPIGVRVGGRGGVSTFALRRAEAACVQVWPDKP
jgi:ferrous iron transport protein A